MASLAAGTVSDGVVRVKWIRSPSIALAYEISSAGFADKHGLGCEYLISESV